MPRAEFLNGAIESEIEHIMTELQLNVTDLGPNNIGSLGPGDLDEVQRQKAVEALAAPEYQRAASRRWICVDGRTSDEEKENVAPTNEADPQTGGGLAVSESAADYMDGATDPQPLSQAIAKNTRDAVSDDYQVVVHGDEYAGKAGCKANADMQPVLRFNAENADIVGAKTWAIAELLKLDGHISRDDVTQSLLTGKQSADNKLLWDIKPEEVPKVVVENGGEYVVLRGEHHEKSLRSDLTEDGAFAKAAYNRDMSTDKEEIHAFAASFGAYKKMAFERAAKHGRSEREAALKTMRAVAFNVGLSKWLSDEAMPVGLVSERT
jgi:hypothetical protein